MAITQTQINSLISDIEINKASIALNYSILGLNEIYNEKLRNSLIKLQVILDQLLNYDTENYTDTYFYDLSREADIFCNLDTSPTMTVKLIQ